MYNQIKVFESDRKAKKHRYVGREKEKKPYSPIGRNHGKIYNR